MSTIYRARAVVGSLYALMRNRLGLDVDTPLEAQELSATVAPDRRLVVLGHEPIAGVPVDHGAVADEAALLALHTYGGTTLLAEPRVVVPGDIARRTDTPGAYWLCVRGNGTTASDWVALPSLAATLSLAAEIASLSTTVSGKQDALANAAALAPVGVADGLPTWGGAPWPGSTGSLPSADLVVAQWAMRVAAAGGVLTSASLGHAEALCAALRTAGVLAKISWLLPFLGADLTAAMVPLVDRFGRLPRWTGFAADDFAEALGLTGDGTAKYIDTLILPDELSLAGNGGIGAWACTTPTGPGVFLAGSYSADWNNRYALQASTGAQAGYWGQPGNGATVAAAAPAGHYYTQRSSAAMRALYLGGASIATSTASDGAGGVKQTMWAMACRDNAARWWSGRVGLVYFTNGSLTSGEITALHSGLAAWMAAVGRI